VGGFGLRGFEGLLLAPGVGVDVEDVAVLNEAVDESSDAGGAGKDRAPALEGELGADDGGALEVAAADDVWRRSAERLSHGR